ncbi:MAG: DegV family protein [Oscillospiraceae bacterium]
MSTSQPSPADTLELWDKLLEEYDQLVYIPMSSGLSGTAATAASLACDDPYEGRVFVADNKRISAPQRQSVLDALALRERGQVRRGDQAAPEGGLSPLPDLHHGGHPPLSEKGGRITPTAALLGSALNLKPILQLQAGKLDAYKKVRGTKAAKTELVHALEAKLPCLEGRGQAHRPDRLPGSDELGAEWNEFIQQAFPQFQVYSTVLP